MEKKEGKIIKYRREHLCSTLDQFNVKAILFIHSRTYRTFTHNVVDGVVR